MKTLFSTMLFYLNAEPWEVLLHGDAWSNNMIFSYDQVTGKPVEVILINLRMCQERDPFKKVKYALYPALQKPMGLFGSKYFPNYGVSGNANLTQCATG